MAFKEKIFYLTGREYDERIQIRYDCNGVAFFCLLFTGVHRRQQFVGFASGKRPPEFQRYRFLVKNGAHLFHHEKREGNHWPLTEKDITVTGTKELSQAEWQQFFNYLKKGKVEKRKEHLEDGGRGPWMFLYWKGDKGKIQEYSFPSWDAQKSFEEFCIMLKNEQLKQQ